MNQEGFREWMKQDARFERDECKDSLAGELISGTNDGGLSDTLVKDKRRLYFSR